MAEQKTPFETGGHQSRAKTERRAWIRFPCKLEVTPQPLTPSSNADTAWLGTIRDISAVGIALTMSQCVEPGTALVVETSAESNELLRLPVRVVHVTPEVNAQWIIGCELARELSPQEFSIFLGK
jgi:hypothetical protein